MEGESGRWSTLGILTLVYAIGELSRFMIFLVTKEMAQDIHYGDMGCFPNSNLTINSSYDEINCAEANTSFRCQDLGEHHIRNESACVWDYTGFGQEYQILTGPPFTAIVTISGILIAMVADRYNRRNVVAICLILVSVIAPRTGAANSYWEVVTYRMIIGVGMSVFLPACGSLISDIFPQKTLGLAFGIFCCGKYLGSGLAYIIGTCVTKADVAGMGWRFSFFVSGIIGLFIIMLLVFRVTEPLRPYPTIPLRFSAAYKRKKLYETIVKGESGLIKVGLVFSKPLIIMLIAAASLKQIGTFSWTYNYVSFFSNYYPRYDLVWIRVANIIGGTLGVISGGFVSDELRKNQGLNGRLYVMAGSLLIATPLATSTLFIPPPLMFYALMGAYFFAEMWFGVFFALVMELVPPGIRCTTIAIFLFMMDNIGSNVPILIEPFREALHFNTILLIMYPGFILLSSVLFMGSSFFTEKHISVQFY